MGDFKTIVFRWILCCLFCLCRVLPIPIPSQESADSSEPFSDFFYSSHHAFPYGLMIGILFLLLFGGLVSGLTIGLMTLDETNLKVLSVSGSTEERLYASRILPIRRDSYLLLCTLLVANAIVTESLPILVDRWVGNGWQAVILSTFLLLIFAEILPQAFFTKFGLSAGAHFIWLVKFLIFLLWPIAYPLSKLVYSLLGHHHGIQYKRGELKALVAMLTGSQITAEEVTMMTGVLELIEKRPVEVMIPLADVYMLDMDQIMDEPLLNEIRDKGYSRIPLYGTQRENVVAILLVKRLISGDTHSIYGFRLRELQQALVSVHYVSKSASLFDILADLRQGSHGHLALVVDHPTLAPLSPASHPITVATAPLPLGIITLEDIIEELLQEEIVDETDEYIDVKKKTRVPGRYRLVNHQIPSSYLASKLTPQATTPVAPNSLDLGSGLLLIETDMDWDEKRGKLKRGSQPKTIAASSKGYSLGSESNQPNSRDTSDLEASRSLLHSADTPSPL